MKSYNIGYTQGVFDMFHIGHLNLLNNAKKQCEYLMVGVNTDKLVKEYKFKTPIIREEQRCAIVQNIKAVNRGFLVNTLDKFVIYNKTPFDVIFIGNDWKGNARWMETETKFREIGVEVVYLPYTKDISSTVLRDFINEDSVI